MNWTVALAARLVRASQRARKRKGIFLGLSLAVFLFSLAFLARLDLLPDAPPPAAASEASKVTLETSPLVSGTTTPVTSPLVPAVELPITVEIPTINLSTTVLNPNTTNISLLDKALLSGAVRYPLSARLGEAGNVIIFGHSSYLPFANPIYKTFDGIQKLKAGDTITVSSQAVAYVYAVDTVSKENISSAAIPLTVPGKELTLSTCDSFGAKSDRFVVTAHFVESHPIPTS
ncbi:MAG: hypothetical protein B7X04_04400 [Parcubacteria group bacterium 21-54-25]|nr:MAG: hypothetical protein B7X04_04400 [Parcubacteria group bacterium 21-54-25]HQU08308.1 sortase [Candidatus Paceibacterota bacterium]